MESKKLSKSQKRKQRLLRKGKQLALPATQVQVVRAVPKTSRRRRRNRNRRGTMGMGPMTSGYFQSLLDPEKGEGAKIPDLVAYPSGTVQLTANGILTTGATAGDSVAIMIKPIIGDGSTLFPINTFNSTSAGNLATQTGVNWSARAAVNSAFELFRPVSASVEVYFIGNSTSDGGRICGCCFATGTFSNYTGVQNLVDSEEWPLRNGMKVLWKPLDESNFDYVDQIGNSSNVTFNGNQYPFIIIAATGLPVNATNMAYRVVVNFEAIPTTGYYDLVETTPSPYDPGALRRAFEWAAEAGNNVMTLAQQAGPYVRAGYDMYRMGPRAFLENASTNVDWLQLPQRQAVRSGSRRSRASSLHMTTNRGLSLKGFVSEQTSGKDEESEDDMGEGEIPSLNEALQSFSRMQVRESSSLPGTQSQATISSPGLQRFRKGS